MNLKLVTQLTQERERVTRLAAKVRVAERQRDRLAEALRGLLTWFDRVDKLIGSCPPADELPEVTKARAALSAVERSEATANLFAPVERSAK